jgi:signal transduction histidine kinase
MTAVGHGGEGAVEVDSDRSSGELRLQVSDRGPGFDPAAVPADRLGIIGMRRRVELLEGVLEIRSAPGAGPVVVARIPWS